MAAYEYVNSRGVTFYLHEQKVIIKGNREQTIHFFAKNIGGRSGKETPIDAVPADYYVVENPRNGFPTLKKKK